MAFWIQLLVGLALNIVAYLIMPKPKPPQPPETKDLEDPTAEAGKPVPVVFGSITVKGLNILWFGEKATRKIKVDSESSGKK